MADQKTSFNIIWRYNEQKWYYLVEQTQGYLMSVNLFRFVLTDRKPRGAIHQLLRNPCTSVG